MVCCCSVDWVQLHHYHLFMICFGYQIRDGNVVVDNYQHDNSHHIRFIITPLNCIDAAITAPISAITATITATITAAVHGEGVFDQQQEEEVFGDLLQICV